MDIIIAQFLSYKRIQSPPLSVTPDSGTLRLWERQTAVTELILYKSHWLASRELRIASRCTETVSYRIFNPVAKPLVGNKDKLQ